MVWVLLHPLMAMASANCARRLTGVSSAPHMATLVGDSQANTVIPLSVSMPRAWCSGGHGLAGDSATQKA